MVIQSSKTGFELNNKVALISGGAQGMGEEIYYEFSKLGAKISMADIQPDKGNIVINKIKKSGGEAIFFETDATIYDSVEKCVKKTLEVFGTIDILVNVVGLNIFTSVEEWTLDSFDRIIRINLYSPWHFCKAVIPEMMRKKKGKIVNFASGAGIQGVPKELAYVAAKHGVVGLTRALAVDLGGYYINVNAICPASTVTPMLLSDTGGGEIWMKKAILEFPIPRLGRVSDQAKAAAFLSYDASDWITGAILPVDGGLTSCVRAHHNE
jgi:NAD(P)-dependent dehydrogenase (short-subunit alcohol dehydrogenase family)